MNRWIWLLMLGVFLCLTPLSDATYTFQPRTPPFTLNTCSTGYCVDFTESQDINVDYKSPWQIISDTDGTTYFYVVDWTDGSGNVQTSAKQTQVAGALNVFFVSRTGSGSTCSAGSPCAISRIGATTEPKPSPGETWTVVNGTYPSGSIAPINCAAGASNGTPSLPITIRAQNAMGATLQSNGLVQALKLSNCRYWIIDGFHVTGANNSSATGDISPITFLTSSFLTLRNTVVQFSNAWDNAHLVYLNRTSNSLIENVQLYSFHRHALLAYGSSNNNIFRNLYCHGRSYPPMGSATAGGSTGGNACVSIYPGSGNILENVITENSHTIVEINAAGYGGSGADNNRLLGAVHLGPQGSPNNANGSLRPNCRHGCDATIDIPRNNTFRDVLMKDIHTCLYNRGSINTVIDHLSCINPTAFGYRVDNYGFPGPAYSFAAENSLVQDATNTGFSISGQAGGYTLNFTRAYNNVPNYSFGSGNIGGTNTNSTTTNPVLGTSYVCVPRASNVYHAGAGGGTIGAELLYLYRNGVKTTTKMWNKTKPSSCGTASTTGIYPSYLGACKTGVNSDPANSLVGVADRLSISETEIESGCGVSGYFP